MKLVDKKIFYSKNDLPSNVGKTARVEKIIIIFIKERISERKLEFSSVFFFLNISFFINSKNKKKKILSTLFT